MTVRAQRPDPPERVTLFETTAILVTAPPEPRAGVVAVSFGGLSREDGPRRPITSRVLAAAGIPEVHLMPKHNHWWQLGCMTEACATIRDAVAGSERVVTLGSSMGGFGAFAFARAVGARHAVGLSPQSVLLNAGAVIKDGWRQFMLQGPLLYPDAYPRMAGLESVAALYDPRSGIDRLSTRHVARHPGYLGVPCPFAGHKIGATLREMGIHDVAILGLVRGDLDRRAFRAAFRAARRTSPAYLGMLRHRLAQRDDRRRARAAG